MQQQQGAGPSFPFWLNPALYGMGGYVPQYGEWEEEVPDDLGSIPDTDTEAGDAGAGPSAGGSGTDPGQQDGQKAGKPAFNLEEAGSSKLADCMREMHALTEEKNKQGVSLNHNVAVLVDSLCADKTVGKDL